MSTQEEKEDGEPGVAGGEARAAIPGIDEGGGKALADIKERFLECCTAEVRGVGGDFVKFGDDIEDCEPFEGEEALDEGET